MKSKLNKTIIFILLIFVCSNSDNSYALVVDENEIKDNTIIDTRFKLINKYSNTINEHVMVEDSSLHETVLIERHYERDDNSNYKAYIFQVITNPFQRGRHLVNDVELAHGDNFLNDYVKIKIKFPKDAENISINIDRTTKAKLKSKLKNIKIIRFELNESKEENEYTRSIISCKGFIIYKSEKRLISDFKIKYLSLLGFEVSRDTLTY